MPESTLETLARIQQWSEEVKRDREFTSREIAEIKANVRTISDNIIRFAVLLERNASLLDGDTGLINKLMLANSMIATHEEKLRDIEQAMERARVVAWRIAGAITVAALTGSVSLVKIMDYFVGTH